jgi:prepilin-type N-terminal cleavage/methylation domain-containing protein
MREIRRQGFTLVELMIVVAIIGILASVAIPSFLNYQLTAKRAEGYSNLNALSKAQKAYYAEFNTYVASNPEPLFTSGDLPTQTKRDSTPINVSFAAVGWAPEGDVFFDYDTATVATPLLGSCALCAGDCFTSSAYGDLDGNGLFSILIYAHADPTGGYCTTGLVAGGGPYSPPLNPTGDRMIDEVARVLAADTF